MLNIRSLIPLGFSEPQKDFFFQNQKPEKYSRKHRPKMEKNEVFYLYINE